MDKHPLEMTKEELDYHYGKPKQGPKIVEALGWMGNLDHDLITVDVLTNENERLLLTFNQNALRIMFNSLKTEIFGSDKPRAQ